MAELEFRETDEAMRAEGATHEIWKGIVYGGLLWSDGTWTSPADDSVEWLPDELDQIAAKLRSPNGEPNTRSTDERVRELLEWLREAHNAEGARIANAPFADPERESVEAKQEAFIEVHLKINELFPACKPSEDNQNG